MLFRSLAEWLQERGPEVHFGEGGIFEQRRRGDVVQFMIDFIVASPDSGWISEADDWLFFDHESIGGSLVVDELRRVDEREVIDWVLWITLTCLAKRKLS